MSPFDASSKMCGLVLSHSAFRVPVFYSTVLYLDGPCVSLGLHAAILIDLWAGDVEVWNEMAIK